ncbi:MAG: SAM-dependent methyltransferase [Candidatus Hodarchaeota archaeon]
MNEAVEWRIPIWAPAVESAFERAAPLLPRDANVLEVGYSSGMMSCFMASHYGWHLVGYDISESIRAKAVETARRYGLQDLIDFRVCLPDKTLSLKGRYDAVFIKSFLYHISDRTIYRAWIDWLRGVVRDGGVVIVVENGKGWLLDNIYRRAIKKSRWASFLLFDRWAEQEFKQRFRRVDVRYFGRFSQFFTPLPKLCKVIRALEEKFWPANADRCFVASIIAQR